MKIALISPPDEEGLSEMVRVPNGLAYIAAVILEKGYEVKGYDGKSSSLSINDIVKSIKEYQPDIIGITAMTPDIIAAAKTAKIIKHYNKELPVVLGGAHGTALPEDTLNEFSFFDIIIIGEGEETIIEFIELYKRYPDNYKDKLKEIKGIAYKNNNTVVITQTRPYIIDLDKIPFPAWQVFPIYKDGLPIYSSRGCPYQCNFCMRVSGNSVRKRSPENIVQEIQRNLKEFDKGWWFEDETFGVDKKWLFRLLDLMIAKGYHKRGWGANSRINLANKEVYAKMREAGCRMLTFGIESGNETILSKANKGITKKQIIKGIQICKDANLKCGAFFILGHPFENKKTIFETIRFAIKLNTDDVAFGRMVPYPGTEIYEMAKKGEGEYINFNKNWLEYRKYHGNPVELKNLTSKAMLFYQFLAYALFYGGNFRFKEFLLLFYSHRKSLISYIKKTVGKSADIQ